jgi:hypothetical protein
VALEWLDPGLQAVAALLSMRPGPQLEQEPPRAAHRSSVAWILQERMQPGHLVLDAAP